MKKLVYLVPFILIGLSLSPFALYKDTVNFGSSFDTLSPGHWKILSMQLSQSVSLDAVQVTDADEPLPEPEPVSKDAAFKGFPFGAYFSRSDSSSSGSFTTSAYSWLWIIVDALLIIISLVLSFRINRTKKEVLAPAQSFPTQLDTLPVEEQQPIQQQSYAQPPQLRDQSAPQPEEPGQRPLQ